MKFLWTLLMVAMLAGCIDSSSDATAGEPEDDSTEEPEMGGNGTMELVVEGEEVALSIAAVRDTPIATHAFDKDTLAVNVGDMVTIDFSNDDTHPLFGNHDFYIEALDLGTAVIGSGETESITFTVDLEPGEYVFYCTVGNHRADGMEGMLVVS